MPLVIKYTISICSLNPKIFFPSNAKRAMSVIYCYSLVNSQKSPWGRVAKLPENLKSPIDLEQRNYLIRALNICVVRFRPSKQLFLTNPLSFLFLWVSHGFCPIVWVEQVQCHGKVTPSPNRKHTRENCGGKVCRRFFTPLTLWLLLIYV